MFKLLVRRPFNLFCFLFLWHRWPLICFVFFVSVTLLSPVISGIKLLWLFLIFYDIAGHLFICIFHFLWHRWVQSSVGQNKVSKSKRHELVDSIFIRRVTSLFAHPTLIHHPWLSVMTIFKILKKICIISLLSMSKHINLSQLSSPDVVYISFIYMSKRIQQFNTWCCSKVVC